MFGNYNRFYMNNIPTGLKSIVCFALGLVITFKYIMAATDKNYPGSPLLAWLLVFTGLVLLYFGYVYWTKAIESKSSKT